MARRKKITVEISEELLRKAQRVSGEGPTGTVVRGLEILAASPVYERLLELKGKVHLKYDIDELRRDRR
jgi:hypothetical protein